MPCSLLRGCLRGARTRRARTRFVARSTACSTRGDPQHARAARPGRTNTRRWPLLPTFKAERVRVTPQDLAQPIPRLARALGTNRGELLRHAPARLRHHRVPTGALVLGRALTDRRTSREPIRAACSRSSSMAMTRVLLRVRVRTSGSTRSSLSTAPVWIGFGRICSRNVGD